MTPQGQAQTDRPVRACSKQPGAQSFTGSGRNGSIPIKGSTESHTSYSDDVMGHNTCLSNPRFPCVRGHGSHRLWDYEEETIPWVPLDLLDFRDVELEGINGERRRPRPPSGRGTSAARDPGPMAFCAMNRGPNAKSRRGGHEHNLRRPRPLAAHSEIPAGATLFLGIGDAQP